MNNRSMQKVEFNASEFFKDLIQQTNINPGGINNRSTKQTQPKLYFQLY